MTVAEVCKLIAPHVEKTFPSERATLYNILDLVKEKIWFSGKFYGSTKWGWVKVRGDGTIITPHGYNILLGCKPENGSPKDIKDAHFLFHKNGPTSSIIKDANFNNNIVYLGEYPTLLNPEEYHLGKNKNGYRIVVVAPGIGFQAEPAIARVVANDCNGNPIYTYIVDDPNIDANEEVRQITNDDIDEHEGVITGIDYKITGNKFFYKNITVSSITAIQKEPTTVPVEFWLHDLKDCSQGILMSRMEPNETVSLYKSYKVPNKCIRGGYVYGLFKMSKPQNTVSDNEQFIVTNKSAIIDIARGVYKKDYKEQMAEGRAYIDSGISALNDELRESNPNTQSTLQIQSTRDYGNLPRF